MIRTVSRMGGRGGIVGLFVAAFAVSGCQRPGLLDWDLRRAESFSTAEAARTATAARPRPEAHGVISYPNHRVAIARRGETVAQVAQRVGVDPQALARQNALDAGTTLRGGETLVLPEGVALAAAMPAPEIAVAPLAAAAPPAGAEPIRHQVQRGETIFTIARLYNVSSRTLAEWNGLGPDMEVREGQTLIIPTARAEEPPVEHTAALPASPLAVRDAAPAPTTPPGQGTPTPTPPSASAPLPLSAPEPAGQAVAAAPPPPVANMQADRTQRPRLAMPVEGRIIRAYSRGRNDGIGIGAPAGTPVRAAAAGTVAAITRDTDQVPIMVVRHEGNLLTVYANIDDIRVERGATVRAGQTLATVRAGDPSFLHFEVREGFESVDPMPFLQ